MAAQWSKACFACREGKEKIIIASENHEELSTPLILIDTLKSRTSTKSVSFVFLSDFLLQSGSTNFGEKFSRVKFSPSLTLFGGKPMEGWLAVTVSGLVSVSLLKPNGALLSASESLSRLRGRVALADIAFTGGGNIVVATTDGGSSSPVQFYKVCVSVVSEKCRIDTELLPSLFMRCTTDPVRRNKYPAVTHLKFLTRENSEQVRTCLLFCKDLTLQN